MRSRAIAQTCSRKAMAGRLLYEHLSLSPCFIQITSPPRADDVNRALKMRRDLQFRMPASSSSRPRSTEGRARQCPHRCASTHIGYISIFSKRPRTNGVGVYSTMHHGINSTPGKQPTKSVTAWRSSTPKNATCRTSPGFFVRVVWPLLTTLEICREEMKSAMKKHAPVTVSNERAEICV